MSWDFQKKPVVYLDCNVVSCLTGWLSTKADSRAMQVVERAGFRCPLITSPDKLPEDWP